MGKGVIKDRPNTASGTAASKVVVVTSLDPNDEGKINVGSVIDGKFDPSINHGDFVTFTSIYDAGSNKFIADQVKPDSTIKGTVVTGPVTNVNVPPNSAYLFSGANVSGNIEMAGGILVVADKSIINGKIKALTNPVQVIIMDSNCTDEVKIHPNAKGSTFIAKTSVFNKEIDLKNVDNISFGENTGKRLEAKF